MLTKLTALLLSVLTFLTSLMGCFNTVKAPEQESDFVPVIRFIVGSDIHVTAPLDRACGRIQKAISAGYSVADSSTTYNKLDAVMFAGDITDQGLKMQYLGFKSAVDSVLRDGTQLMAVVAKSHDCNAMGRKALDYYSSLTGLDTDYHYVINGFHFIGISASKNKDEHYSEYQRTWLSEQLQQAAKDDPSKPIFLTQHEHIRDTVYGSSEADGWGMDYFSDIIKQYPQIVDFSGHSHYPLNDPRSIWQGDFTAVGTGTLKYFEFTVDSENTIHPDGYRNAAQIWVVEVDANNRIRLRGMDLLSQTWLCEYTIENPSNPNSFEFTPEKQAARSTSPVFASNAEVKSKGLCGKYTLTFPAAASTDSMPVFLYRAFVYDENGNVIQSKWALSGYYFVPSPSNISIKLDKLGKGNYTVKVYAETAYGVRSQALTKQITVN